MKILIFIFAALAVSGCVSRSPLMDDAADKSAQIRPVVAVSERPATPPEPARITTAPRFGEMAFEAEKVAMKVGCYRSGSASLMAKRPGIEFYRVGCETGNQILVKCEMRQCRIADMPVTKRAEGP
ncbi:MAG: hypothetical protein V4632_06395 [Pseudomonadota bacterium]